MPDASRRKRSKPGASALLFVGLAACGPATQTSEVIPEQATEVSRESPQEAPKRQQTLARTECSPQPGPDAGRALLLRMDSPITWGDTPWVCGFLRVPADMPPASTSSSLQVQVREHGSEEFHPDAGNFLLGSPELRSQEEVAGALEKRGELYFEAGIFNEYTILSPGTYDISLRYLDLDSERLTLVVEAGGWRGEVSEFLVASFCQGTLHEDYEEVIQIQDFMNTADMDEAMADEVQADLEEAEAKAFAKYKSQIRASWRDGMQGEPRMDYGVARFAEAAIREACPERASKAGQIVYIYDALKGAALSLD